MLGRYRTRCPFASPYLAAREPALFSPGHLHRVNEGCCNLDLSLYKVFRTDRAKRRPPVGVGGSGSPPSQRYFLTREK